MFPAVFATMPLLAAALLQSPPPQSQAPAPQVSTPQASAPQAPSPRSSLGTVVIDAAHGGTDTGARGESGVVEKEVVASLAQSLKREFERQGLRVVLTRAGDSTSSFDDRAAIANTVPGAVFLTLHVASSGEASTAIAYSLADTAAAPASAPFASSSPANGPPSNTPKDQPQSPAPSFLIPWQDAQLRFVAESRRLAELLQIQLADRKSVV